MTKSDTDNGNGDGGITSHPVAVLTFTLDLTTWQVSIGGQPLPLSLAQMICGEGARLLEEQRRVAAAMALRESLQQAAQNQAVADALRKSGGRA